MDKKNEKKDKGHNLPPKLPFQRILANPNRNSQNFKKRKLPPLEFQGNIKEDFEKYFRENEERQKNEQTKATQQKTLSELLYIPGASPSPNLGMIGGPKLDGDINQGLTSSLLRRVTKLEKTVESYRREIKQKLKQNHEQKTKIKFYEQFLDSENHFEIEQVYEENKLLKEHLDYIQDFLASYGLKWKGLEIEGDLNITQLKEDTEECNQPQMFRNNLPKEIELPVLEMKVGELNHMILKETGTNDIVIGKDGIRRFEPKKAKNIVFFKDGVILDGFPLYKYGTKIAVGLIADLYDGFFPKQLEKTFPDGVLLKIIDKLDERHADLSKNRIKGIDSSIGKPMSKQEFLNKIPKKIIRNGEIVDVREGVNKIFEGESNKNTKATNKIDTGTGMGIDLGVTMQFEKNQGLLKLSDKKFVLMNNIYKGLIDKYGQNETTLEPKVNFLKEGVCVVKMRMDETQTTLSYYASKETTIACLKVELQEVLKWGNGVFLFNNFPRSKIKGKDECTLNEAGMFPRAAIHIVKFNNVSK